MGNAVVPLASGAALAIKTIFIISKDMANRGKALVMNETKAPLDHCVGIRRKEKCYVEMDKGATTTHFGRPTASIQPPIEFDGMSIESAETKYPQCSDFINWANLTPDEVISLGEWNLSWDIEEPNLPFAERYTHHRPPPGPILLDQRLAELFGCRNFVDTNISEPGKAKPETRLPTRNQVTV